MVLVMGWLSCVGACGGEVAAVSGMGLAGEETRGEGAAVEEGLGLADASATLSRISSLVPVSDCMVQVAWPTIKGRVYTLEHCGCVRQDSSGYYPVYEAIGDGGAMSCMVASEMGCAGFFRLRVSEQVVPE